MTAAPAPESVPENTDLIPGDDGLYRPQWAYSSAEMLDYFDYEWGKLKESTPALFEALSLELLQSGLSWSIILRKRETIRHAFKNFDPAQVANFGAEELEQLMDNPGVIRHRRKLEAIIANARCIQALEVETTFARWLAAFAAPDCARPATFASTPALIPQAKDLAKALKKAGFQWVGPTTTYSFMQAVGLVDSRPLGCAPLQG
ncbi:MAG: DNA-3-methyladenine glycosylase I [Corynebacterium sp.]|nr:DNA-3-methyladenine glycosylase I [Corynebacterium sp.]